MKQVGAVEVPQEAFLAVLNMDDGAASDGGASGTSTSTCRSARTAAATATSSPSTGTTASTAAYVDALLAELELERGAARSRARDGLPRRRHADVHRAGGARAAARRACPRRDETTVEANPETVTPSSPRCCAARRQSRLARRAELPAAAARVLERRAAPDDVRARRARRFAMPALTTSRSI